MAATLQTANASKPTELSVLRKLGYSLIVLSVAVGSLELALRLTGFCHEFAGPTVVAEGVVQEPMFREAEWSIWVPEPGKGAFNADGFIGPQIPLARQPGTLRIAALGDSCTHWGSPPYPQRLQQRLAQQRAQSVEVLNAGVAGYSTYQGLWRLREHVLAYKPDIVVVYFGWNDHWLWRDHADSQPPETPENRLLTTAADYSRIVQASMLLRDTVQSLRSVEAVKPAKVLRVPPDEYRRLLHQIVAEIRNSHGKPVLVTAPTDLTETTPISDFAILEGLQSLRPTRYSTPKELHDAYVQITREVATAEAATLVDAYRDFAGVGGLITADHIHLTDAGMDRLAELLANEIQRLTPQ